MKYLIKLTVIFTILFGGLFMSSCCGDDEVFSSGFNNPDYYEVHYTVKGTKLKLDVKKTNPQMLLVVSVDEVSDTITSNVFVKAYSLKKGKHTVEVEAGYKTGNGLYVVEVNSKSSQTIYCE